MCTYERERDRLAVLLDDVDTAEDEDIGDESSGLSDNELMSNHESDTEQELENDEQHSEVNFVGKDGTIWRQTPFKTTRPLQENIFRNPAKLTIYSENVTTPHESWKLFFNFIDLIVEYSTNLYILKIQKKYKDYKNARSTDRDEINALFGLLCLAGVHKSAHLNVKDIWTVDGSGIEIFSSTMSYKRFLFLLKCIRFDDFNTRQDRRKCDKLAPIRDIFEIFNKNCEQNYNCGSYITVDEKLESFRGRCSFRQYIPNKPAKY